MGGVDGDGWIVSEWIDVNGGWWVVDSILHGGWRVDGCGLVRGWVMNGWVDGRWADGWMAVDGRWQMVDDGGGWWAVNWIGWVSGEW